MATQRTPSQQDAIASLRSVLQGSSGSVPDDEMLATLLEVEGWDVTRAARLVEEDSTAERRRSGADDETIASPGPQRLGSSDPRDNAETFVRELEEQTGATTDASAVSRQDSGTRAPVPTRLPPFFIGGYADALKAAKEQIKILAIVLVSREHGDDDRFKQNTLTDGDLVDLLSKDDFIVWGGDPLSTSDSIRFSFRLPGGKTLTRRFSPADSVAAVFAFVETSSRASDADSTAVHGGKPDNYEHEHRFSLVTGYPRKRIEFSGAGAKQLKDVDGLSQGASLIVEGQVLGEQQAGATDDETTDDDEDEGPNGST
uniref:UBX domain-containing protein n=1 Tax=Kalmanozyma brasiliensis (strain GHG001) TaxID=1365824 RepID=V5GHU4_KALBG